MLPKLLHSNSATNRQLLQILFAKDNIFAMKNNKSFNRKVSPTEEASLFKN